jgi:transposase
MSATNTAASKQSGDETLRGPVIEVLRTLLSESRSDEVIALVSKLVSRNAELEKRLHELSRGKNKGEGISSEQLSLLLHALQEETNQALADASQKLNDKTQAPASEPSVQKPPRQPSVRRPPPQSARRIDNPIAVPARERLCPVCGEQRVCIGHDVTEIIDLIPAEVVVRLDRREKLACERCEGELVRAPIGDKVVEGGIYGSALVAKLIVDKYHHGMPLNRQRQELSWLGLDMPSASCSDQICWGTDLLRPLWREAQSNALSARVMQLDSTSLPVRDKENGYGVQLGSLCAYVGDAEVVAYLYTSTAKKNGQRAGELGPEDFLSKRVGPTVADASNAFDKSFARPELIEVGCNAHARRGFVEALDARDTRAALPIAAFKRLYEIEALAKNLNIDERTALRRERSRLIYDELLSWCRTYRPHEPPKTPLAQAVGYLINHCAALTRFIDDGELPIDNTLVERLHRRPAITRRSFLFAGSHAGGERAAIAFSVLATCDLCDVNPVAYLSDVLPRLARGIKQNEVPALMPKAWKLAQQA